MSFSKVTSPLVIPALVEQQILPDESLSVFEFLHFKIPLSTEATTFSNPQEYLSKDPPNVNDIEAIRTLPSPPPTVIQSLMRFSLMGIMSVQCPHTYGAAGKRYPLWVIGFWSKLLRVREARKNWTAAVTSLQKRQNTWRHNDSDRAASTKLVEEVNNALNCIPWSGSVQGFETAIPMHRLSFYATRQMLHDDHEDQMLDLLRGEMMESTENGSIQSTPFMAKLKAAYTDPEKYADKTFQGFRHLRSVGEELARGIFRQLGTIAHVDDIHWIALVLDFESQQILFGDSLGGALNKEVCKVVRWWTELHTGKKFTIATLPISRQIDGYSCGLLAWNALVVHFLPKRSYSLMKPTMVDNERLKVMLRVIQRHHDQVGRYLPHHLQFSDIIVEL